MANPTPLQSASASVSWKKQLGRWILLLILTGVSLQLYFLLRIAAMVWIDPQSTAFQRSEMWRLFVIDNKLAWSQSWTPAEDISPSLKRAVIASEDSGFMTHGGVEWDALKSAWQRNERAEAKAEKANQRAVTRAQAKGLPPPVKLRVPKVIGGSTITQQLAKNLFLSGERNFVRKGQEFLITFMLEAFLSKQRILEIYLNNVEWGEGVFGAQAASRHYFRADASQLNANQAARLAVMLPAPKRFEKNPTSNYVRGRAAMIAGRLSDVDL